MLSRLGRAPKKNRFALLVSIAAHSLLLAIFFFARLHEERRAAPVEPTAVFVDLPKGGEVAGGGAKANGDGAGNGRRAEKKSSSRGRVKLRARPHAWESGGVGSRATEDVESSVGGSSGSSGSSGGDGWGEGRGARVEGFANGLDLPKETRFYPFARALYARLDTFLEYPPDFVEGDVQGDIVLHFLVDGRGRFTGRFLEATGDEAMLRTYAMAAVICALKDSLPERVWREEKEIPIAVRISFRLYGTDEYRDPRPEAHYRNHLHFARSAFTKPRITKKMERALAKYWPPVVIFPGGFYVDFVLLHKQLTEGPEDDPEWKRGIRLDLEQQGWENVIRRGQG